MPNNARPTILAASAAVALLALAGCSSSSGSSSATTSAHPRAAAAASANPSMPAGDATSSTGLTLGAAEAACQLAGVRQYPYGFDPHWSLGFVSADSSSGSWVIKAHADVADDSGKRADKVVTCTVAGTDDSPQVASVTVA
jgi:hypothetical protein